MQQAGMTAATAGLLSGKPAAIAEIAPDSPLEIRVLDASGQPAATGDLESLYFLSLTEEPLPQGARQIVPGRVIYQKPPPFPVTIAARLPVPEFGQVTLYADNQGRGYNPTDFPINLPLESAHTRLQRVQSALDRWQQASFSFSLEVKQPLAKARAYLAALATTPTEAARQQLVYKALAAGLWAGERATLERAQQRIQRQGPRPDFLFGCNCFGHPDTGPEYDRRLRELFNFATLGLYWQGFEPQAGQPNFARSDGIVDWLERSQITPKGHPLVWFHPAGIPDWLRNQPYEQVKPLIQQRIRQVVQRYGDRIPYYDVINEANLVPWANELNYSQAQLLELSQLATRTVGESHPSVRRIINLFGLWAEYIPQAAADLPADRRPLSPYQYLQNCLTAGVSFEVIGIQLYYPNQDMFEIDRQLDRFSQLGKPIHITELGVSSAATIDPQAIIPQPRGLWHAPWSEAIQADWIEQFYTLCYSKPYIQAVSWWDLHDRGHFWPHGGLLRADLTPKTAYYRLQELLAQFRQLQP